ncbi:hypothetical protein B484DRAFT_447502 [Ochromonadaceae sp. CCMP2298]|nr:hypothetical protein B484DRAFT_447502 [Ochromonadaceae sp. CCMP2298]
MVQAVAQEALALQTPALLRFDRRSALGFAICGRFLRRLLLGGINQRHPEGFKHGNDRGSFLRSSPEQHGGRNEVLARGDAEPNRRRGATASTGKNAENQQRKKRNHIRPHSKELQEGLGCVQFPDSRQARERSIGTTASAAVELLLLARRKTIRLRAARQDCGTERLFDAAKESSSQSPEFWS